MTAGLSAQAQPAGYYWAPPPVYRFAYPPPYRPLPYPPRGYWPAPVPAYRAYPPPVAPAAAPVPAAPLDASPISVRQPDRTVTTAPEPAEPRTTSTTRTTVKPNQRAFIERLLPIVERENARLVARRQRLHRLIEHAGTGLLTDPERAELRGLARQYRVDGNPLSEQQARNELLRRIDIIPGSLVLAQAANESAWGTSRFAREGNNLFGIWTYDESKGIVPKRRAPGKRHLVRRFDSLDESVRYYMHTLNSHPAYRTLRRLRAEARDRGDRPRGSELAAGLTKYSARGEEYVRVIRELIHRYDLASIAARPHTG